MLSPGQKRSTCGHVMASFDGHVKCARCRNKGVGEDACVLKKDCIICKGFTPEQILQLATPTYRERKSKEKKLVSSSPAPTLVDPSHVSVLGKVERGKVVQPETTPAAKKTKRSESPKPSANKKKSSSGSRPSADDLKKVDAKWAERFSRLEAMLLAKSFTVPVEPVVKPAAEVTTNQKPFFDPGASTSSLAREISGRSLVQATGEAVEEMQTATQPLEAPRAGTVTQPVQAPGSVPEPSGEGDLSAASDSEGDQHSVTGSLSDENYRYGSPDRDLPKEEDADQEFSEEANYQETMRGIMCNQAAGLSRCLTRVQDAMSARLKTLHLDKKGKSSERTKQAIDELDYLVTFNRSISQAMARTVSPHGKR